MTKSSVVLDVTPLQTHHRYRGIGTAVRGLVSGMRQLGVQPATWGFRALGGSLRTPDYVARRAGWPRRVDRDLWVPTGQVSKRVGPMHFTNPDSSGVGTASPYVVTVYDLIPLHHPDDYLVDEATRKAYRRYVRHLTGAARIIAISTAVAEDVADRLGIGQQGISVAPLGVDRRREPIEGPPRLPPTFVYLAGTTDPHKNAAFAVDVMATLPPGERTPIIMAGAYDESALQALVSAARSKDVVLLHLGRVSEDALTHIYRRATCTLFPSKYEGFGLPAIEALSEGCPVLVSDRGALPEVVGPFGVVLPLDHVPWRETLRAVLRDRPVPDRHTMEGHLRRFSWRDCARETLLAYAVGLGDEPR